MIKIDGKTKVFGVIADPIEHVKATEMYNNRWLFKDKNYVMVPIHVLNSNLVKVLHGLKSTSNFHGLCVTIPHKIELAKQCDFLMPNAKQIGAVNVAYFNNKRELIGENFDGEGFVSGLEAKGFSVKGKKIFISGAGGAARGIAFAMAKYKASLIVISNRTKDKAIMLSDSIKRWYPGFSVKVSNDTTDCEILINTTSLGLNNEDKLPFELDKSSSGTLVADIIMQPEMTKLLKLAQSKNLKIHFGKHMLNYQADLMEKFLTKQII